MRSVYILLLPDVHMLDLAGPLQILCSVRELGIAPLTVRCVSFEPSVLAYQEVMLSNLGPPPDQLKDRDSVFVIGSKLRTTLTSSHIWRESAAWLANISKPSPIHRITVAAVCTGAFLLGEAGLLDDRLCTTHHNFVKPLRKRFARATVLDNRVFVRDGNVWTTAGVASGIDLALHLIAKSFGDEAAIQVARENVVPFRRFLGDPVLSENLRSRSHANQLVHSVQDSISKEHLALSISGPEFARAFGVTARHLSTLFRRETGLTLKQYQLSMRLSRARELLRSSSLSIEVIAMQSGFSTVQAFRLQWDKTEPNTPSKYRLRHARQSEVDATIDHG